MSSLWMTGLITIITQGAADCNCLCDPKIKWIDDETGLLLARPMVIHNSFDGREKHE